MAGAGGRIEALRFSLLIVLTIALLSVAFRINSHSSAHSANVPRQPSPSSQLPSSSAPSSVEPSSSAPASVVPSPTEQSPSVLPTETTRPGGGAGAGGTTPPTLPRTGWDNAMRLGGLSLLLIGGGTFAIRLAGPRRRPRH